MSKYYKAEDIIRKRAETLADTSYWEYGNPKNVDEWIEVAEMEFKDLPTIDIVRCEDCVWRDKDKQGENYCTYAKGLADIGEESFCSWGERKDDE